VKAANVAARIIARLWRGKPRAVLGLATGSTPLQLYQTLIGMPLDWSSVTTFNLDEYIGTLRVGEHILQDSVDTLPPLFRRRHDGPSLICGNFKNLAEGS